MTAEHGKTAVRHGFRVGAWHFLIPSGLAAHILDDAPISPMPLAANGFVGMVNFQGDAVPVFALPSLLGLGQPQAAAPFWLLVLGAPTHRFALLIDTYPQTLGELQALDGTVADAPPDPLRPFVHNIYQANGLCWFDCHFGQWLASLKHQFWL